MDSSRYQALISVGGIGAGVFFALNGNHTLGREESRSGRFLDARDYYKLHIITHYVQTLLGPPFVTLPIGRVGDDDPGRRLLAEMQAAGLDLRFVEAGPGLQTLYAICLIYPDGSGGNLTTDEATCARADAAQVAGAELAFRQYAGRAIALSLPEAPLAARQKLLELATANGLFRAASFTSSEMQPALELGLFDQLDLLAMNRDEAAALGLPAEAGAALALVEAAAAWFQHRYPALRLSLTAGADGSWTWDGGGLHHVPARPTEVASAAGAGDAHLAGILAGLAFGLSLAQAQEVGALAATMAVTSPHTINPAINRGALRQLAASQTAPVSRAVRQFLEAA